MGGLQRPKSLVLIPQSPHGVVFPEDRTFNFPHGGGIFCFFSPYQRRPSRMTLLVCITFLFLHIWISRGTGDAKVDCPGGR